MTTFLGLPCFGEVESFEECWSTWCLCDVFPPLNWSYGFCRNRSQSWRAFSLLPTKGFIGAMWQCWWSWPRSCGSDDVSRCVHYKLLCFPSQLCGRQGGQCVQAALKVREIQRQPPEPVVNMQYLEFFCKKDLWYTVSKGLKLFHVEEVLMICHWSL